REKRPGGDGAGGPAALGRYPPPPQRPLFLPSLSDPSRRLRRSLMSTVASGLALPPLPPVSEPVPLQPQRRAGAPAHPARAARARRALAGGPRRYRRRFAVLLLADVLALSFCMALAGTGYDLFFWIGQLFARGLVGGVILAIGLFAASGLYSIFPMPPVKEVRAIGVALGAAAAFLAVAALALAPTVAAAVPVLATLGVGFGLATFAVPTARLTARALFAAQPWWGCQTVVLGHGEAGRALVETLRRQPELGLAPAVLLEDDATTHG